MLHSRFLHLGNPAGDVEVIGRASLTEAAGAHPLFNGVRAFTITGLADEPTIIDTDGLLTVRSDGVNVKLRGSVVERSGQVLTIRLPASP